jgi:cyclic pyranopterin phosphate synthase
MAKLTHVDEAGRARMVDVSLKRATRRRAVARGRVRLNAKAFRQLSENRLAKGDALAVARLAGIQAAKRTAEWIPLCHSVPLDHLEVSIDLDERVREAEVTATASARWTTGVEMEALVAVSAACLALYDMAKAVDRGITIGPVQLLSKSGGRTGRWTRGASRRRGD